ncbi:uncharacterized protein LOC117100790 isoform X3 [Anneissia japonica]|uniref:uncharacterized protein LOC117100790 isoform X3 n=1 Tax=Anneissia japonica TaxID=1529436 RepID=UPI0014257D8F|nr:uncharacterized protein LOC117100790 isoform X3 [Anneissia japonica]
MNYIILLILLASNVQRDILFLAAGDTLNQPSVCPQNKRVISYRVITQKIPSSSTTNPCSKIDYHRPPSKECTSGPTEVQVTRLEKYATNLTIFTCCNGFKPLGNTCVPDVPPTASTENDTLTVRSKENTQANEGIDMDVFLMAFSIVAAGVVAVILIIILSVQCRRVSCFKITGSHGVVRVTRREKKRHSRQEFAFLDLQQPGSRCSCIGMSEHTDLDDDTSTTSLHRRSLPSLYEIQGFHVKQNQQCDPCPLLHKPIIHPRPRTTGGAEVPELTASRNNQFDCDDYAVVLSFANSFKQSTYASTKENSSRISADDYVTSLSSKVGHLASTSRHGHVFSSDSSVTNDYVTGVRTCPDDMAVGYVTTVGTSSNFSRPKTEPRQFPTQRFAAAELDSVAEYITSVKTTHDNIRSMVNRDSTSTYDSSYMTPMDATRTLSSNASVDYDDVDLLQKNCVCGPL